VEFSQAINFVEQNYPQYSQAEKYTIAQYVIQRAQSLKSQQAIEGQSQDQVGGGLAGSLATGVGVPVAGKYAIDSLMGGGAEAAKTIGSTASRGAYLGKIPSGASGTGGFSLAGAVPVAGAVAGTYLGGKAAYDMLKGRKPDLLGRATLGIATGGLSEVAKATGLLDRKTTQQYQQDGWKNLANNVGENNPTAQYIANYQKEIANPTNKNPAKFEDMQGLDLTPGKAFFDTFGRDWLEKFSEPERIRIAQEAKDKGLIHSRKGDIVTSNMDALRQLYQPQPQQANPSSGQVQDGLGNFNQAKQQPPSQNWASLMNNMNTLPYRPLNNAPAMLGGLGNSILNSPANRLQTTPPVGGVGGPGFKPDPNRPGHFIRS
jgi:hypothetical protein